MNLYNNYFRDVPRPFTLDNLVRYYKRKRILLQMWNYKRFYFF